MVVGDNLPPNSTCQDCFNAAGTSIAKPWRREIYLHNRAYPHPTLRPAVPGRRVIARPRRLGIAFFQAPVGVGNQLDRADADRVLSRADRLPLTHDLVDIAKIVASFAYFGDDRIQDAIRSTP